MNTNFKSTQDALNYYKNKFNNQFVYNNETSNKQNINLVIIDKINNALQLYNLFKNLFPKMSKDGIVLIVDSLNKDKTRWTFRAINLIRNYYRQLDYEAILCYPNAITVLKNFEINNSEEVKAFDNQEEYFRKLLTEDIDLQDVNVMCALRMQKTGLQSELMSAFVTRPVCGKVDIVFAIGDKNTKNDQLKIALRSIEKNAINLNKIYIVTNNPPSWIQNVEILNETDSFDRNKDGNIIKKILCATKHKQVTERFIFWSDDQILMNPYYLNLHTPVYNNRGLNDFLSQKSINRWDMRMIHTLKLIYSYGGNIFCNWESHVPQPYDKTVFRTVFEQAPFHILPGLCINTAYYGLKHESVILDQLSIKDTIECKYDEKLITNKLFLGYNDEGYNSGLKQKLLELFPEKSKYQK